MTVSTSYASKMPFVRQGEEFLGAGLNSSYSSKLYTFIRPDFLRISGDGGSVLKLYSSDEIDCSVVHAIDTQREMHVHNKGDLCKRLASLYGGQSILASPLETLQSHHFFTPIFAKSKGR